MLNGKENIEKEKMRMKDRSIWRKNGHVCKKKYKKVKDLSKKGECEMGSAKWTHHKEWTFATNYFIFLKI